MKDIIENIIKKINITEQDTNSYVKEGLKYCKLCDTPKQKMFYSNIYGDMLLNILCKCNEEEKKQQEIKEKLEKEHNFINTLRNICITEKALHKCTFENTINNSNNITLCEKYVNLLLNNNITQGILFKGDVGVGKTHLALCIANKLIDNKKGAYFTNLAKIISDLSNIKLDKEQYINNIMAFPVVIIDDFGIERDTSFALEQVYRFINARYNANKPLIITTNLTSFDTDDITLKRIFDRINYMCPITVNVKGENQREVKRKQDLKMLKELFI